MTEVLIRHRASSRRNGKDLLCADLLFFKPMVFVVLVVFMMVFINRNRVYIEVGVDSLMATTSYIAFGPGELNCIG